MGERGFARAGKSREPEIHGFVIVEELATGSGYGGVMPDDVGLVFSHGRFLEGL
jgi:hypothetical protein